MIYKVPIVCCILLDWVLTAAQQVESMQQYLHTTSCNQLAPSLTCRQSADNKCSFMYENVGILIRISLVCVHKDLGDNEQISF